MCPGNEKQVYLKNLATINITCDANFVLHVAIGWRSWDALDNWLDPFVFHCSLHIRCIIKCNWRLRSNYQASCILDKLLPLFIGGHIEIERECCNKHIITTIPYRKYIPNRISIQSHRRCLRRIAVGCLVAEESEAERERERRKVPAWRWCESVGVQGWVVSVTRGHQFCYVYVMLLSALLRRQG